jgi:predicted LPLAT superfamily acyltransferase
VTLCAIVPSYNHWKAIGAVIARLHECDLPVFVIDDGSVEPAASALAALHDPARGVTVHRLPVNQGKGTAVIEGFRLASAAGFTHALQVDADGQHDLDALAAMVAQTAKHPDALISGLPQYDDSIPAGRKIGRWITHFWVWVETLSFQIADSMCGFRIYPLAPVRAVLETAQLGRYMDFDTEIMVRLFWRGMPVIAVPVKVIYPPDNTSNFRLWRDNIRISWMHARLVFEMLWRLPSILRHRPSPSSQSAQHWATLAERGAYWGLRFCAAAYQILGRNGCRVVLMPIVAWFFLADQRQRRASRLFLDRALGRPATVWDQYRHFFSFAERALDTFAAWIGAIPPTAVTMLDRPTLKAAIDDPRGALVVVAHFGNADLARAVLDAETRARLMVLVHTRHAANYNQVLREFRPEAALNLIQVTEIGPETAVILKEHIERGDWVIIAGDRTPVGSIGRVVSAPFLGTDAPFAQGPWILAALLGCPVHLLFCVKNRGGWDLTLERFAERVELPRGEREAALAGYVRRYAARLESYARAAPFQWYNFFDFWAH